MEEAESQRQEWIGWNQRQVDERKGWIQTQRQVDERKGWIQRQVDERKGWDHRVERKESQSQKVSVQMSGTNRYQPAPWDQSKLSRLVKQKMQWHLQPSLPSVPVASVATSGVCPSGICSHLCHLSQCRSGVCSHFWHLSQWHL